jgi:hypothetical protein
MTIQLNDHQKKYINPLALKWIEALKSGGWKQCKDRLANREGGFCCLGVAAEVSGWNYNPAAPDLIGHPIHNIGLESVIGRPLGVLPDGYALYKLNDDKNWTFEQIADWLLQHPEEYFIEISPELALQG